jgi:hypothetical protein
MSCYKDGKWSSLPQDVTRRQRKLSVAVWPVLGVAPVILSEDAEHESVRTFIGSVVAVTVCDLRTRIMG